MIVAQSANALPQIPAESHINKSVMQTDKRRCLTSAVFYYVLTDFTGLIFFNRKFSGASISKEKKMTPKSVQWGIILLGFHLELYFIAF